MATAQKPGAAKAAPDTAFAGHAMAPRLGEPGATYSVSDARGTDTEIHADEDGIVRPTTGEQVRVADANGLPYLFDKPSHDAEAAAAAEEN